MGEPLDIVVCYAKCVLCQFGQHPGYQHTWMESEDLEHAGLPAPTTEQGWGELAVTRPCGCYCMRDMRDRRVVP